MAPPLFLSVYMLAAERGAQVVKTMLETLGHSVSVAWDGSECIERLFDANGKPLRDAKGETPERLPYRCVMTITLWPRRRRHWASMCTWLSTPPHDGWKKSQIIAMRWRGGGLRTSADEEQDGADIGSAV